MKILRKIGRRLLVECTFSMIKRKFGARLFSKSDEAQINEVLCKFLCHNIVVLIHEMFELGIDINFEKSTMYAVSK